MPPRLYDVLFSTELARGETVARQFRRLSLLCHLDKRGREANFKVLLEPKNRLGDKIECKLLNKRDSDAVCHSAGLF